VAKEAIAVNRQIIGPIKFTMISSHIFTLVHKYISTFNDKPIVICSLLVSPKNMKGSCISNKQTSSLLPKHRSEVYKRSAERK
jgi:hypothetical protein